MVAVTRPAHPLGKAIVSVNLMSWLIIAKYVDGLPLYRLEKILARYGGDITRTTMANWLIRLHTVLEPLLARLEQVQLSANYQQGDETRICSQRKYWRTADCCPTFLSVRYALRLFSVCEFAPSIIPASHA